MTIHIHLIHLIFLFGFLILPMSCKQDPGLTDPLEAGWNGEKVCELIHEDDELRVLKCTFPPGVGHERHYHKPHFGYTLAGSTFQITDTTGIREVEILSGTNFTSDGVDWHEVLNVGDSTGIFLIIEPK